MRKIILLLTVLFCSYNLYSQQPGRLVYVEAGGPGVISFNYDQRFNKTDDGWGFRVGVGGYSNDNSGSVYFPIDFNYAVSKDNKNFIEVGGGITFVSTSNHDSNNLWSNTFGHLNFSYRVQPKKGGVFFKVGLTPVFGSGSFLPYIPNIGFGFKF